MHLLGLHRQRLTSPRHFCRGRALAIAALLAGCTTTHALGRADDPGTRAQLGAEAVGGDVRVHLLTDPVTPRPPFGYRVSGVDPSGVIVETARGQSLVVPLSQVTSLSRYDRVRGARNGAIAGGIVTFITSVILLALIRDALRSGCSDGCGNQPDDTWPLLGAGLVVGLAGAGLGGALGAAIGYEDRFVVAPR